MTPGVPRAPGGYRWAVLAIGVLAQASFSAYHQGLPAIGPALQQRFGVSLVLTGALFSAVAAGVTVGLIPWGVLADRFGERVVLAAGLFGAAVALALASVTRSYAVVLVALAVAGASGSCANAASGRAVMAWFGPRERGTALGVRQMATPLGGALAALALPVAVAVAGVPAAFWLLAAVCVVAAVACGVGLRRGRPSGAPVSAAGSTARSPMRDRRLWRLAIGGALIVAAQLSLISYLVLFLGGYRRMPLAAAALVLTACQFLGAGARVAAGAWSDRARERIAPMRRLALAGVLLLVAVAAGTAMPLTVLVPVVIACTVVNMSTNGLAFTATGELAGQERAGTAMGFQNTLLFISGAVAPIAFGAAVTAWGWRAGFVLLAASALAGWGLLAPLVAEERGAWGRRAA